MLQQGTGLERPQLVELLLRYPAAWDMSPLTVVQHLGQLGDLLGLSRPEALQVVGGAPTGMLREAVVVAMRLRGADLNACWALPDLRIIHTDCPHTSRNLMICTSSVLLLPLLTAGPQVPLAAGLPPLHA